VPFLILVIFMHNSYPAFKIENLLWRVFCIVLMIAGVVIAGYALTASVGSLGRDPFALLILAAVIGWMIMIRRLTRICF
jgi:hypothetical protein